MQIDSSNMEKTCTDLKGEFSNYFDWNKVYIEYLRIDINNKKINILSSNYENISCYWCHDFKFNFKKRLSLGVNFRSDYPDESVSLVERLNCNKIEICIKTEELVEVLSIKFKGELPKEDFFVFYAWRAIIADYAYRIWNKNKNITIPLTEDICFLTEGLEEVNSLPIGLIDIHKYMRFGDVRFTRKEIITIRMLLFHCKIKEISAFHGCSEASEHKRIQRIKQKLNYPYASSSRLFTILRTKGITLACLEGLITYR